MFVAFSHAVQSGEKTHGDMYVYKYFNITP